MTNYRNKWVNPSCWVVVVLLMASWVFPLGFGFVAPATSEAARIKDIASIEGVRDNQLIGYGLIVGLDRTGDSVLVGSLRHKPLFRC